MQDSSSQMQEDAPIPGLPPWTWASLEAVMLGLAANPPSRAMVHHLVAATRLESPFLPAEHIRRELAMIFFALVDPSFPKEVGPVT
jgi:hypothetical protein